MPALSKVVGSCAVATGDIQQTAYHPAFPTGGGRMRIFIQPPVIFLLACISLLSATYLKLATKTAAFAIEHGSAVSAPGQLEASTRVRKPDGRLQDERP